MSHLIDCDELIKMVSANPILFDRSVRECFDPGAREDTWRIIGEKIKCPVEELKKKWKGIRDSYLKSRKKQLRNSQDAYAEKNNFKGYKFVKDLEFLDPHLKSLDSDICHISIEPSDDQSYTNDTSNSEFDNPVIEFMQVKGTDMPINSSPNEGQDSMPQIFMDSLNSSFQSTIGKCSMTTWQPAIGKCSIIQDPVQDIPDLWPDSKQRKRKAESLSVKSNKHYEVEPKRSKADDEDPNWCFLKSIHFQLNRLPDIKQSKVKIQMLKMLHEAEFADDIDEA